jgi:hypothetical protein
MSSTSERCPEPETLAEKDELLDLGRVLEFVLRLSDHDVPRDHRAILPRGG